MKTIYRLCHRDWQDQGFRCYQTLTGARIAQRQRNRSLGFDQRIERVTLGDRDIERCVVSGEVVDAVWEIQEITVDDNWEELWENP